MEQSLSSLAFGGSIVDAIAEAKRQKKLFVVYIAGDNPESKLLETSTWIDPNVSETLSKYCILLHILEGSLEASNFQAIYSKHLLIENDKVCILASKSADPQHSAPCITVVGYNGVQLWRKEGFVQADVLASNLEKAWLSLHVQETTAAFLTAALASGKQTASGTSGISSEQVTSGTNVSTPLTDDHTPSVDAGQPLHSETMEDRNFNKDASEDTDSKGGAVASPEPAIANALGTGAHDESISKSEAGNASGDPVEIGQNNPQVACHLPEKNLDLCDNRLSSSREIINEASEMEHVKTEDAIEVEKADAADFSAIKSNDVLLNIRLPDGSSLQLKFSIMDTLKMVKDSIKENQGNSLGSFSVAIPYPRKVFNDQELDSSLSELGLFNRQALVVVPHNQNNSQHGGGSSQYQTYSSNDDGSSNASEGYWQSMKKLLSYVNIFSYLNNRSASSPSAVRESPSGIWQYSPNPSLQDTLRDGQRPSPARSSDQSTTANASSGNSNSNNKSRQQTSRFGSNIHTLKHDDDDDSRFNNRNAFWNGNSTQYGGDNDGK